MGSASWFSLRSMFFIDFTGDQWWFTSNGTVLQHRPVTCELELSFFVIGAQPQGEQSQDVTGSPVAGHGWWQVSWLVSYPHWLVVLLTYIYIYDYIYVLILYIYSNNNNIYIYIFIE